MIKKASISNRSFFYSAIPYFYLMDQPNFQGPDPELLKEIVRMKMPFGKYKGYLISDLPESYLLWFHGKGFPPGKLGMLMSTCYEIRLNGMNEMLYELKQMFGGKDN